MVSVEGIIWYLFLIDSIGANIMFWCCPKWYKKNMRKAWVKHVPASKGWALMYLVLVAWIGCALNRCGIL